MWTLLPREKQGRRSRSGLEDWRRCWANELRVDFIVVNVGSCWGRPQLRRHFWFTINTGPNNILNPSTQLIKLSMQLLIFSLIVVHYAYSLQLYNHGSTSLSNPAWMGQLDNGIPIR